MIMGVERQLMIVWKESKPLIIGEWSKLRNVGEGSYIRIM